MRKRKTGYKDKIGKEICENDIFKWTIPKGFKMPDMPYSPLLYSLGVFAGAGYNEITEDTTTISLVTKKDGTWKLVGIKEDKGWETELCGLINRAKYGIVIGNKHDNPELLEK